jgi:hypothetical protein
VQTALKKVCSNFFCLNFYHEKRSTDKQEITAFPVADEVNLVGFGSLNESSAFWKTN